MSIQNFFWCTVHFGIQKVGRRILILRLFYNDYEKVLLVTQWTTEGRANISSLLWVCGEWLLLYDEHDVNDMIHSMLRDAAQSNRTWRLPCLASSICILRVEDGFNEIHTMAWLHDISSFPSEIWGTSLFGWNSFHWFCWWTANMWLWSLDVVGY